MENWPDVRIVKISERKKRFLELLLLADEEESMIDRYLELGEMFAMKDRHGIVVVVAVVTQGNGNSAELKNLAVTPDYQHKGYGRRMIDFICRRYSGKCRRLLVGTGEAPATVGFYTHCGFRYSHRIKNFF